MPDDDDDAPTPLLLPDRNVDISSTILSILLLGSTIHPAVQNLVPILTDPNPSLLREITLAETIRRNQRLLLLTGKLPVRRCFARCGALNSLDLGHRP